MKLFNFTDSLQHISFVFSRLLSHFCRQDTAGFIFSLEHLSLRHHVGSGDRCAAGLNGSGAD